MLEGLVAWVLNNYLGKYVENLNTDQLSIAMLSGKVELENLPLKKDALRHLGLPIEVKAGFIGKVQLQVPVRQIRTAPWVIVIERLYLVAAPVNLSEWDPVIEANILHERKVSILDELEAQWRAENEAHLDSSYYASSYSSWLSYGTGLLANIAENLQLKLKDVHIRYEDCITCASPFACGFTAESLTAESCDSSWQKGFTNYSGEVDACSYKLVELQKMAVYWDPVEIPGGLLSNYTLSELTVRMSQTWTTNHNYIAAPSTAIAYLKRERTEQPLRSKNRPRITCNLTLDQVVLNLTNEQYNEAVGCNRGLSVINRLRTFRERRPLAPVQQDARAWWVYAVKCHFPESNWMDPKPTWESCLESARSAKQYVEICLWTLLNPAATLPMDKKEIKDNAERNMSLEVLKPLREIAMRKVPKAPKVTGTPSDDDANTAGRSMLVQWFPQWWGWYGNSETPNPNGTFQPNSENANLEEEILDALADSIENNTILKRDTVFGHFDFTLNKGCLNLSVVSGENGGRHARSMLELQFEKVCLSVQSRPRTGSHMVAVTLGAVELRDKITQDTLFPILVAPQGTIREGLSGMNVAASMVSRFQSRQAATSPPPPFQPSGEPLFQLVYERKPFNSNSDHKLFVKSQSLEMVYNNGSVKWLSDFISRPLSESANPLRPAQVAGAYVRVRDSTKAHLINQWEHLIKGHAAERSTWHIELDISAPQIMFVEDFTDRNGTVLVVDFGKMQLTNVDVLDEPEELIDNDDDDTEMFMTPCSTPPGSVLSPASPQNSLGTIDANELHRRLYDRYKIEFSDLQILVGRARDNWKYAHNKGTSSLHLLDRFSISLQAERRVVQTSDPQYPSALLAGTLPSLVVHLSEHKVAAVRSLLSELAALTPTTEPVHAEDNPGESNDDSEADVTETDRSSNTASKVFVLQFSIDQMSLEVQSRSRSIAEVQVCGVRASFTRRPCDYSLALSVHSLLLVDALQTYGPDFELLVASHKHVGMDASSGSIRDSEPTSPTSPASPSSSLPPASLAANTLAKALSQLHNPQQAADRAISPVAGWDAEALIAVEMTVVQTPDEEIRIANIVFNNLDIIANQETIVELIGFARRVLAPKTAMKRIPTENQLKEDEVVSSSSMLSLSHPPEESAREIKTEITFDFHRLSVLLLRATVQDGTIVAKKIATATMSGAKIQATICSDEVVARGSLGGLSGVSLCAGGVHSRVLSVGREAQPTELYPGLQSAPPALDFNVTRTTKENDVSVNCRVHVASVWYTHSGRLLGELASCVGEFRQYLANLARSIRAAAADMAIGLVQPRSESGSTLPRMDSMGGRRTRTNSQGGMSFSGNTGFGTSLDNDSAADYLKMDSIVLSVDIQLETPVVVLPRSTGSTEVFVAHLGNIYLSNIEQSNYQYSLQVRDISLYSLDIADRLKSHKMTSDNLRAIYSCNKYGKPVLHNTTMHLDIVYDDTDPATIINGKIVTPLRISATREQYEQLLDTLKELPIIPVQEVHDTSSLKSEDTTDAAGVTTLRMDPHIRARVFTATTNVIQQIENFVCIRVNFQLPSFTIELRTDFGEGEISMVDVSFRDFNVNYDKSSRHETNIQVSLHSITMEDLTKDVDSRHRLMMVSHTPQTPKAIYKSKSCPDFLTEFPLIDIASLSSLLHYKDFRTSLPDYLHIGETSFREKRKCGVTPPSSPRVEESAGVDEEGTDEGENLVLVTVRIVDPEHPRFESLFDKVARKTKVDFNCLNLVVNVDSWVTVLDFFGVSSEGSKLVEPKVENFDVSQHQELPTSEIGDSISEVEMNIRRLSAVLVGRGGVEACRAAVCRGRIWSRSSQNARTLQARLPALALHAAAAPPWRRRLLTAAHTAVQITYQRLSTQEASAAGYDSTLGIEMSFIRYVHTKRFVAEIQAFFRDFSLLQSVLAQARRKVSVAAPWSRANRMRLRIDCVSPVIVIPVSSASSSALVIDMERLTVENTFKYSGDEGTFSTVNNESANPELLDIRIIRCENTELYCGQRVEGGSEGVQLEAGVRVVRRGPSLLTSHYLLQLQMETSVEQRHTVPDMTIHGTLDTIECAIDPKQYSTIRGVLSHNLGEDVSHLNVVTPSHVFTQSNVWTLSSIHLELLNVVVRFELEHGASSLACVNFIRSRLLVETYSDLTQDIDLVSQEILVSDTRFQREPVNKRSNVFTNIVQPMSDAAHHSVQAELHARKRRDTSAYTILVNNMRLMAILDWWDAFNKFIMSPPEAPKIIIDTEIKHKPSVYRRSPSDECQFELKLNITESQVVLVEDTSMWDSNAVILKSTTVISYRPGSESKPVSCVLNHCEVFSCVVGMEDETALSIIDPVTVHIDLSGQNVLQIQVATFCIRLSYHDMRMFASIFKSIPAQARSASSTEDVKLAANAYVTSASVRRLTTLGFCQEDCMRALRVTSGREDDAALWLTRHARPAQQGKVWPLTALQLTADCITLCVIDDCLDSDVPLLELSFSELTVSQDLRDNPEPFRAPLLVETPKSPPLCLQTPDIEFGREAIDRSPGPGGGKLKCLLSVDYYNRALSGWEPVVEPWRCDASWEYTLTSNLSRNRLQLELKSRDILNINITSALIQLYKLVKTNWTQDYYSNTSAAKIDSSPKSSPPGYRRRSPFVPFALNNQTGHKLWFTTIVTSSDATECEEEPPTPDDGWWCVCAGATEPFSFGPRRPRGALRTAPRLHALALRVHGWTPVEPVCVDRVGTFFRLSTHLKTGIEARIVFVVTLEGSARKLVTVRSALQIVNELPHSIEVKFDSHEQTFAENSWTRGSIVDSGCWMAAPLGVTAGRTWLRPLPPGLRHPFLYCDRAIDWRDTSDMHYKCRSSDGRLYRFCCINKREKFPPDRGQSMPGHTITLKPPLRLVNLLPIELQYCVEKTNSGNISAGFTEPYHEVDVSNPVELWFKLDGFGNSTILTILPNLTSSFATKVKLVDNKGRRLYLNAYVSVRRLDTIKILISAPYWIINRTGVPLVFRQEGTSSETAGQYEEHEIARMVAPLLFSFTHSEGSPTIVARVGNTAPGQQSEWCAPLGLGPGCAVRRLKGSGGRSLELGVCVRAGRGRYRRTNMVVVAPRLHLHNNTSYVLQFAQSCHATTLCSRNVNTMEMEYSSETGICDFIQKSDPMASSTFVSAVAGCSLPFHWTRTDKERLLCVRPIDTPNVAWSGAFPIDKESSIHLSCRDPSGGYFFIRVEVVLQGATFFVVLTDADTMPPPIRIKNLSPVSIAFHQVGHKEECVIKPHSVMSWVLPEPCGEGILVLGAPGGTRQRVSLDNLNQNTTLMYQNFIYVVFTQAGYRLSPATPNEQSNSLEDSVLVFEVQPGSNKVILGKKRYGDRCQLWRRGPNNQLIHEGSSPPQATNEGGGEQVPLTPHSMVLDIETAAPQPGTAANLVLRRADARRISTQTWRLVPPGRMCCAHSNLCVQPSGGLFGLRPGNRVALGMMTMSRDGAVPLEQAVAWLTLRPGSGFLGLSIHARGPTRLLTIVDVKAPEKGWVEDDHDDNNIFVNSGSEFEIKMSLGGVGVSLISRTEELLYAVFSGIFLEATNCAYARSLNVSVSDLQCDNQLVGSTCPVVMYALRGVDSSKLPAFHMAADITPSPPDRKYNALIFKHFIFSLRPIAVKLEEKLLLKLCAWGGLGEEDDSNEDLDENDFETQRLLNEVTAVHAKRYYFGVLKIMPSQIRLSVQTASKLSADLQLIKKQLNLTLIKFEDAGVELEPYVRWHPFETAQFHLHSVIKHFKKELKWQAAKILGSVDFLGNPLGFMQDVSEGVSGLIYEGNVGALFKNVTHGLSNSAAKVTESLGDGLERVVLDEAHEETRRRIRSSGSHLAAGFRGLGLGLLGGATSLVKHSYEGFTQEGLPGLFAGVGKGLVGTVTKPVIGVLDLATETASALRESSRRADKWTPERMRPTRCCAGPDGLLQRYSRIQAHGLHYLYTINGNDYSESFLAYQCIRDTPHDIRALISDRYLRIFTCKGGNPQIVIETHLSAVVHCGAVSAGRGAHYVELTLRGGGALRRPRVACDTAELAAWLARNVRYARRIHRERAHTLPSDNGNDS